jgi:hypothetical protein
MSHAKRESVCVIAHVDNGWEPTIKIYSSQRVVGTGMGTVPPKFWRENFMPRSMG